MINEMKHPPSPLTQVGFRALFDKLIKKVNEDYGFNLTQNNSTDASGKNELIYDTSYIFHVSLHYNDGGRFTPENLETTFIDDYEKKGLDLALANLETDLRVVLSSIKEKINKQ